MIKLQKWNLLSTKCFNLRLKVFNKRIGFQFNRRYLNNVSGKYLGVHLVIETPFRFIDIGDKVLGNIRVFIPSIYSLNQMLNQRNYYKSVYLRLKRS